MTRINLVPPEELTDQHLFTEFREMTRVPKFLLKSLNSRALSGVLKMIPPKFTLGTGHISFFYDKGMYLDKRFHKVRKELENRGVNFNKDVTLDELGVYILYPQLFNDYEPTDEALALIRARLSEKIAMKPNWYRMKGISL